MIRKPSRISETEFTERGLRLPLSGDRGGLGLRPGMRIRTRN